MQIRIGDMEFTVKAGVSDRLLRSVLLGTDVPAWRELLNGALAEDGGCLHALIVRRVQRAAMEKEEAERVEEVASGAKPSPVEDETESCSHEIEEDGMDLIETEFDDDLFTKYPDRSTSPGAEFENHDFTSAEQQAEDPTLAAVPTAAEVGASTAGVGFFKCDGLLYHRWTPPESNGELSETEQFVLPMQCRKPVLDLAHQIPIAGHMGKNKTAQRVMGQFYWPTLYRDVADHCRSCKECQMAAPGRAGHAPLIPLPIMEEPFKRITMDIVGPLQ